ncbi:MAG: hypothetical protein KDA81_11925 [Planctomycetaceae bacterium]|nr:hypothetical protein [Planctomycetaceae bacterium]
MDFIKWLIGGLVGAAIGGIVWVLVGYFLEAEVGYIAWGIGLLAGIGVRVAAGSDEGALCGIAGVMSAVLVVLGSKYIVVSMFVNAALAEGANTEAFAPDSDQMIAAMADDVVTEFEEAEKPLNWPEGMNVDEAYEQEHYPADVWAEASKRWNELPEADRKQKQDEHAELMRQFSQMMHETIKEEAFKASFAPFDLLWFGLAAYTAFQVGKGGHEEEGSSKSGEAEQTEEAEA